MVFALAHRMTGSSAEADDVLQTCFLNAYRQIHAFRGEASFKTWLYGIALNECRLLHRRSARLVALEAAPDPVAPSVGVHALDRMVLRKLVARLPEKQRAALILRVCDDLPFREIGELIDCSEVAAKVNYFHAVKKLRGWIVPEAETEGSAS